MTDGFEDTKIAHRYEALANDSDRYYAFGKVYGLMDEAAAWKFSDWVLENGLTDRSPADSLDFYYGVDLGSDQEGAL